MKNTIYKNIFASFILMNFISFSLSAIEPWKELWQKAEEAMDNGKNKEAYQELTGAISIMTIEERKDNAFLYLLLAEVNIELENYEEALRNVYIAEEGKLNINDKQKACMTKVIAYMFLGKEEERKKEIEHFREIFTFPTIDHQDKATIIRDVPPGECAKKIISSYLLAADLCESESDIFFTKNGNCFAKRKQYCGCGYDVKGNIQKGAGNCDWWCDKFDATGHGWCFSHYSNARCKLACIATVEMITEGCHFCCRGGGFYQNCVYTSQLIFRQMGRVKALGLNDREIHRISSIRWISRSFNRRSFHAGPFA